MNKCTNCSFTWIDGHGSHNCQEVKDARIAELETRNKALWDALWHGAGVAAKLEFGGSCKYIDKMQTAIHYEWIQKALEKADE